MSTSSRILFVSWTLALAACSNTTQDGMDRITRDAATDAARAKQQTDSRIADAHAAAGREISKSAGKQSKEQAKIDYEATIARADGDLSVALDKCRMLSGTARRGCEQTANSLHEESSAAAKAKLDAADDRTG